MAVYKGVEVDLHAPEAVRKGLKAWTDIQSLLVPAEKGLVQRVERLLKGQEVEPWAVTRLLGLVKGLADTWGKAFGPEGVAWLTGCKLALAEVDEAKTGFKGKDASVGLGVRKAVSGTVDKAAIEVEGTERTFNAIVSTAAVDRYGDIVEVAGMNLTNYKLNPVVLFNHDYDQPVARCVEIGLVDGKLVAKAEFPAEGMNANSDRVYGMMKAGLLNAVSIGFIPDYDKMVPINESKPWEGYRFMAGEMLEFSLVTVPANAEALLTQRGLSGAENEGDADLGETDKTAEGPVEGNQEPVGGSEEIVADVAQPTCNEISDAAKSAVEAETRLRKLTLLRRRAA